MALGDEKAARLQQSMQNHLTGRMRPIRLRLVPRSHLSFGIEDDRFIAPALKAVAMPMLDCSPTGAEFGEANRRSRTDLIHQA